MNALPLVLVMLAGMAFAVLGLSYKLASVHACRSSGFAAIFLLVAALLAGGRTFCEPTAWSDLRLWGLGLTMAALLFGALSLVVAVNRLGPASVSWTLINLSLLIPVLLAPLLLGERWLPLDSALLALFCLMLMSLRSGLRGGARESDHAAPGFWPLLMVAFVLNGTFQFGTKSTATLFHGANAAGLATIYFGGALALAALSHLAQTGGLRCTASEWRCGALAGTCAGVGNLLMLHSMSLPTIVVFPLAQGISLVGGVALTTVLFRERLNAGKLVGFALGLAVLLLALLREPLARAWPVVRP